jgi:TRAP-type C4-dicarboxylate transport system substrate-binding protein
VAGILAELGAHPVYLSGFDPRHAIQNTGIDSIIGEASVLDIVYRKLYEVQDWFVPGPIITAVWTPIMMNKEFFDNLPADLQQIIMEAGEETYQERKYAGDELAEKYLTQLQEEGLINVRVLTPEEMAQWDEIFVPAGRECVKEAGPDAIEIYNMIQDINKDIGLPYQYI